MLVNPLRSRLLSTNAYSKGTVIYQMCRDIRTHDNDALVFAQQLAKSKGEKLVVNYVIWNYMWEGATRRFYDWVIPSLQEVETELRKQNIPLVVTFEDEKLFTKKKFEKVPSHIGAVVIDELPLSFMRKWKEQFLKYHTTIPLYEVDAHNCIPVWELSGKQEFAAHTIRNKVHAKITDFLFGFSDETYRGRIAKAIVTKREEKQIKTTFELVDIIASAVPAMYRHRKTHFATKTFQALRMAVNDELGSINDLIEALPHILASNGRACIITFHSTEDRIVKQGLRARSDTLKAITKKAIVPDEKELEENVRARSAQLRIVERI